MAVYTSVEASALRALLDQYDQGELVSSQGIATGIENTNYFVTTTKGEYVLTLFETVGAADIPYFLDVMSWLAKRGLPSAHPVSNREGETLVRLCGKPATLVERLAGASEMDPTAQQCAVAGRLLGQLHRKGGGFPVTRANSRGVPWRREVAQKLLPLLPSEEAEILREEIGYQERQSEIPLPTGLIHADLFRDNVLFAEQRISGVVDFYYACSDAFLLDIAITANDWCTDTRGAWLAPKIAALLNGYQQERTLSRPELEAWPAVVRAAALRFWLSRLIDRHVPRSDIDGYQKDPGEYLQLLQKRINDGEDSVRFLV